MSRRNRVAGNEHRARRDRGATLIEIIISIVLLGGVIGGSLAAMRATILGGTIHRDHSIAHGWLQSASDVLYADEKIVCDPAGVSPSRQDIIDAYDAVLDSVQTPNGWSNWQIGVTKLQFWNSQVVVGSVEKQFAFSDTCEQGLELQLIEIEVRNTSNQIIETVEIVK